MEAVASGAQGKPFPLFQPLRDHRQKCVGGFVLRTQEEDGEVLPGLLQPGTNCELLVTGERRAHNRKMVASDRSAPNSVVDLDHQIRGVAGLGQEVGPRAQLGDVNADNEYPMNLRVGGGSNHYLIE